MQTKRGSLFEVCLNIGSGIVIANLTWYVFVSPIFNIHPPKSDIFLITLVFTMISIFRSYFWRRLFNWLEIKQIVR